MLALQPSIMVSLLDGFSALCQFDWEVALFPTTIPIAFGGAFCMSKILGVPH